MAENNGYKKAIADRPQRTKKRTTFVHKVAFVAVLGGLGLAGCRSVSVSHYVSPRITGCVIDAGTRQPVQGVKVSRAGRKVQSMDPVKGGQALEQTPSTVTDQDGCFTLKSVRSLTPFRSAGWYSVGVTLVHPAYQSFSTNYSLTNATNTPKGEPLVDAGTILLTLKPK